MGKNLYIAEKPSVAREFANALKINGRSGDGYIESDDSIITWCVGHLVTMSYPDAYDEKLKKWSLETIPFIPSEYKYEVISDVKKQFGIVSGLLNRIDVEVIYVCTDSGREGEYIYRLVEKMADVKGKTRKRVWIDSQTEEEILRGIREAKDLSEYDNLCSAAYLRAKEDYLMGINFSRVLTLKYGYPVKNFLKLDKCVVSVGRVMTCVLGMVVNRERQIRSFVKTPFYRVMLQGSLSDIRIDLEWKSVEGSRYFNTPYLYKENGFKEKADAQSLIDSLSGKDAIIRSVDKKKENKNAPLLYNLAELQNECSKVFKISPEETLKIAQELYEKKLTTYPRTDARVLSTAVSKEIDKNIRGLTNYTPTSGFADEILKNGSYKNLSKTRYVNDKQITDHYAIIPTGQGFGNLKNLNPMIQGVYELIVRRFLSIFYPPAVFRKLSIRADIDTEAFFAGFKFQEDPGYQVVAANTSRKKEDNAAKDNKEEKEDSGSNDENETVLDEDMMKAISSLKKGDVLHNEGFEIKEGITSPPKRYNSGSLILAMENAGSLIEDEELRSQIKGSGIGTSATRSGILEKLDKNKYLSTNKKTQIVTPTLLGEMIYDVVDSSIKPLLDPKLTASWEKGLTGVAEGTISEEEYLQKMDDFVIRRTNMVKNLHNESALRQKFMSSSA
ncbi:MAG: type IA DNA topoisomerase, partial [Lachnospiraceae bacterium]|nr:type IA DNA topoisomerase [Lachnospiraceae bacterium]